MDNIELKIAEVELEITNAESEIENAESEIKNAESKAEAADTDGQPETAKYWRTEERQLRDKKLQLRDKERQLRDKELQLREEKLIVLKASAAQAGAADATGPLDIPYLARVKNTPAPSTFGKIWTEYQFPPNGTDPLYNMGRPFQARGLPAALAHPVFGRFLDNCRSLPIQQDACTAVLQLSKFLCQAYWNTDEETAAELVRGAIPNAILGARGGETRMMTQVRKVLLTYFRSHAPDAVQTQEPASSDSESTAESDGTISVSTRSFPGLKLANILLIEGKEDWSKGDNSNPSAQLLAYYSKGVVSCQNERFVQCTVYPAFGLEVFGNIIRVSALFYSDKISMEPLTEHICMMNLLDSQPERMYHSARVIQALALGIEALHEFYTMEPPAALDPNDRSTFVVPWMLQRPDYLEVSHVGPSSRSKTWRCKKQDGTTTFAKVTTAPYPCALHKEAEKSGLVPHLIQCEARLPGNQFLVEMEYLDPQNGWISLADFGGDWTSVKPMLQELIQKWQACCGGKAVHGDLRPPNIFLRINGQQQAQEARILDLAWSGKQGRACYPGFLNGKANWPVQDPDGKKITQYRDRKQLEQSIKLCEKRAAASRSRQVLPPAATGRRHDQGVQGQFRCKTDFGACEGLEDSRNPQDHPLITARLVASCKACSFICGGQLPGSSKASLFKGRDQVAFVKWNGSFPVMFRRHLCTHDGL